MLRFIYLLFAFTLSLTCTLTASAKIYKKGNTRDISKITTPLVCLAGGASDDLWVEGWRALLHASGGGDVVIIRADGDVGTYESWIFNDENHHGFPKVNSVTTLALTHREEAFLPQAAEAVRRAELIFFDGGDQSVYLQYLQGSPLEAALEYALHSRKTPMGGTSAGMAILGGIDFTAKYNPTVDATLVTSELAMIMPTAKYVDLNRQTLSPPYLEQVVTDTHFAERQRQGRLLSFMARAVYNHYADVNALNVKGIGADEGSAYCYNTTTGQGKVYGTGQVHFLIGNTQIERILADHSLDWFGQGRAVKVYSIHGSHAPAASFDVSSWRGTGGEEKYWYVDGSSPSRPVFGESR